MGNIIVRIFLDSVPDGSSGVHALFSAIALVSMTRGSEKANIRLRLCKARGDLGRSSEMEVASVRAAESADVGGSVGEGVDDTSESMSQKISEAAVL